MKTKLSVLSFAIIGALAPSISQASTCKWVGGWIYGVHKDHIELSEVKLPPDRQPAGKVTRYQIDRAKLKPQDEKAFAKRNGRYYEACVPTSAVSVIQ
jgi:hypothetical protein